MSTWDDRPVGGEMRPLPRRRWRPLQRLLKAARWLVDRVSSPLVVLALIVCVWWVLIVDGMLLTTWPWPTGLVNGCVLSFVAGGLVFGERRAAALRAAQAHVVMFNNSESRDALAEVGTCGLCGATPAVGLAFIDGVRYCHDTVNRPPGYDTCYEKASPTHRANLPIPTDAEPALPVWQDEGETEPKRWPARCDWCGRPATRFGDAGPRCETCPEFERQWATRGAQL